MDADPGAEGHDPVSDGTIPWSEFQWTPVNAWMLSSIPETLVYHILEDPNVRLAARNTPPERFIAGMERLQALDYDHRTVYDVARAYVYLVSLLVYHSDYRGPGFHWNWGQWFDYICEKQDKWIAYAKDYFHDS